MKRSVFFSILFLLLVGSVIIANISFVSAQSSGDGIFKSLWNALFGGIFDGGTSFENFSDTTKENIGRISLTALLILLVYSIAGFLPFFPQDKEGIKWVFASIVGVLGFIFVDGADIQAILINYEALGIALTSIIPLVILMVFAIKFEQDHPTLSFVNKFLYVIFGIYLLFKWVSLPISTIRTVYGACFIILLVWSLSSGWVKKKLFLAGLVSMDERSKSLELARSKVEVARLRSQLPYATGSEAKKILEKEIKSQEEIQKSFE